MAKVSSCQPERYGWVDETNKDGYRRRGIVPMPDGPWVRFEDVQALQAERDELRGKVVGYANEWDELRRAIERHGRRDKDRGDLVELLDDLWDVVESLDRVDLLSRMVRWLTWRGPCAIPRPGCQCSGCTLARRAGSVAVDV